MSEQPRRRGARAAFPAASVLATMFALGGPALAQAPPPADPDMRSVPQPGVNPREGFIGEFFDDVDGKFDFSEFLARGGFIPLPVIITEPAVGGGGGIIAQFISLPKDGSKRVTRHMVGAIKTGNGSSGYGYFQSGDAMNGQLSYRFGIGHGSITLDAHAVGLPEGLQYTNDYEYGILGTARLHLADSRWSVGPSLDFRKLSSHLSFGDAPANLAPDFAHTLRTGAVGLGVYFDTRDNPLSPTKGLNAYVEGKLNSGAFGSDRDFEMYNVNVYDFWRLSPQWRLGAKLEGTTIRGDYPFYFAPAINIRGVEAQQFQGAQVLSTEVEVVRQLNSRWSLVGFVGYGESDAGSRRVFHDSGAIYAGGVGVRYKIARLLGLDAGVDLAIGPEGETIYLQFGHAWAFGMN